MLTRGFIKKCALDAGFTLCGVARARVLSEHKARFEAGLALATPGYMDYLGRRFERRLDPSQLLAGARTVIVCALAYPCDVDAAPELVEGRVASYARLDEDYHTKIKRMLHEVLARLGDVRGKVCCDTAPILEKAWAVEAGLGWQGRNSLLVNPVHGSFLLLGEIVLDAEVDSYDPPFTGSGCGSCRACVDACPVGALGSTAVSTENPEGIRTLSTERCISSRTVEAARLSDAVIEPICGWIEGCDLCQIACPKNKNLVI